MSIPDGPDSLSVAFRAVSFVLLLNAAGIPIFLAVFGRLWSDSATMIVRLGWKLAVAAMVFVTGHHLLEGARMAGEMSGMLDPAMQAMALHSSEGAAFAVRMGGLALVAVALRWGGRSHRGAALSPAVVAVALAGSVLAITSFTLTGHTSTTPHRPVAAGLLLLHLLVVAFWIGALWPLYLAPKRLGFGPATRLIDAFSRTAAWLVPMILLAGAGLAALLVPDLSAFKRPYGQLLLAKVTAFALLMAIAALNKWRFGPACAAGETRAFKQTVVVEYVLICVVLSITATMTTFYSPEEP
jgi:copper resistance protein D